MTARKTLLVDCDPQWLSSAADPRQRYLRFDCPEGHADCVHVIPVTPALDGSPADHSSDGASWQRTGDTFETLTLSPSIARRPRPASRHQDAITAGSIPGFVAPPPLCELHIFITDGAIVFCEDSK